MVGSGWGLLVVAVLHEFVGFYPPLRPPPSLPLCPSLPRYDFSPSLTNVWATAGLEGTGDPTVL